MIAHAFNLLKSAASAARRALYAGQLSPGSVERLRTAGNLPTPDAYARGLERGNVSLLREMGVAPHSYDTSDVPVKVPFRFRDPVSREPVMQTSAFADSASSQPMLLRQETVSKFLARLPQKVVGQDLSKREFPQVAAIFRRHELDELRAHRQEAAGKPITRFSVEPADSQPFFSHRSPEVVRREGVNMAGLSPAVQDFGRRLRSYAKMPLQRVPEGRSITMPSESDLHSSAIQRYWAGERVPAWLRPRKQTGLGRLWSWLTGKYPVVGTKQKTVRSFDDILRSERYDRTSAFPEYNELEATQVLGKRRPLGVYGAGRGQP